ncbi:MAG: HAMP domain-containing histidine kinase, partial [Hyphomicrobiales bacterium]|nr:HAMP domain-containing histidine kinase [Hyphomicrobiales bacterium]
ASMNGLIDRLQAAVEAQKRFVADAAHELRTPLAAMQIEVDNLRPGAGADQARRVAALAASVKRASALANRLLELARLDEPTPGQGQDLDFSALMLDCVAACAPLAGRKGVDLGANIRPDIRLRGVDSELRALLTNLIDNAVRYTPPGGKVDAFLGLRDDRLVAEIVDTGPGLPPGADTRIFDRFYRGASGNAEGTGLGLAIARRVAERHGLALTVENRTDGVPGALARITAAKSTPGAAS